MHAPLVAMLVCITIAGQVHSYPHHKNELTEAEIQTVETALIMRLLQLEDETAHIQATVCNPEYKEQPFDVLTDERLRAVTNVFTHESNNRRTYLYVPAEQAGGRELLVRSTGNIDTSGTHHAEDNMYKRLNPNLPLEFFLTNTPCPGCARNLIARYGGSIYKPLIHATHFYTTSSNPAAQKLSIECLALMYFNGFKFDIWNWFDFSNRFLETKQCKDIVTNAVTTHAAKLNYEKKALIAALKNAIKISLQIRMGKKDPATLCII